MASNLGTFFKMSLTSASNSSSTVSVFPADSLAPSEAIVGQFYVAVLIGRLVSMQLSQRTDRG